MLLGDWAPRVSAVFTEKQQLNSFSPRRSQPRAIAVGIRWPQQLTLLKVIVRPCASPGK